VARVKLTAKALTCEISDYRKRSIEVAKLMRGQSEVRAGATPRDAVMTLDSVTLYHYRAPPMPQHRVPILLVYALVNRPEIADLQAGRSLVAALIERGFDVYLIDWGYPNRADQCLGLDDYITRYLNACVDYLRGSLQIERVTLLGICQGGTFSVCYAALYPNKVARLITTVTPIDFHTADDMLSRLVRHVDIDALVDSRGNISGDLLNMLFLSLKPFRLLQQKYVHLVDDLEDEQASAMFLRMEQWIFDSPALTARACREFGRWLYQENRLLKGELVIGGQRVDPTKITMPVLNIYARKDHLVPPASSRALGDLLGGGDYTEHGLPGGHIGIYVSTRAPTALPAVVADWVREA
jgi:polyhydroxyalkanoate synthase